MTYVDNSPRFKVEREEREAAERKAAERDKQKAAEAERVRRVEEAARLDAQVRAVPESLFADDPQIVALRADLDVKRRQRETLRVVRPTVLDSAIETLHQRVKVATIDAMLLSVEEVMGGEPSIPEALNLQVQADEDAGRLNVLTKARDYLITRGFAALVREREQAAVEALAAALLERKRRHLAEQADALEGVQ